MLEDRTDDFIKALMTDDYHAMNAIDMRYVKIIDVIQSHAIWFAKNHRVTDMIKKILSVSIVASHHHRDGNIGDDGIDSSNAIIDHGKNICVFLHTRANVR